MVVKKFNYFRFISFILTLIILIVGIIFLIKHINYTKTYEYKLLKVGYNENEITKIQDKLDNKYIDKLLTIKYDANIVKFIDEKYFIKDNLDKYLEYKKENEDEDYTKIVSIINTEANIDWLDSEKQTDTSKN